MRRTSASSAAAEQGDGGFGTAFFDALDLVVGHADAAGKFGNREAKGDADVVHGLAEGQGPRRMVIRSGSSASSREALSRYDSQSSHLPFVRPDRPVDLPLIMLAGLPNTVSSTINPSGLHQHMPSPRHREA